MSVNGAGVVNATSLALCAKAGTVEMARLLLDAGADAGKRSAKTHFGSWLTEGWLPLHEAAQRGHLELVRLLLGVPGAGGHVHTRGTNRQTPLQVAVAAGHADCAQELRAAFRADWTVRPETAWAELAGAIKLGDLESIDHIVASGFVDFKQASIHLFRCVLLDQHHFCW